MISKNREFTLSPILLVTSVVGGILLSAITYKLSTSRTKKSKTTVPYASVGLLQFITEFGGTNAPWLMVRLAREERNKGRKCFRLRIPVPIAIYNVGDPDLIRKILSDPLSDKPFGYAIINGIFGSDKSIITSPNDSHWKLVRKTTAPAFAGSEISRMKEIANQCNQDWCDNAEKSFCDRTFDPQIEIVKLTFFIICKAGLEYDATEEDFHLMHESLAKALPEYCSRRPINPFRILVAWLLPDAIEATACCKKLQSFGAKILHEYEVSPNKSKQNTLIKLIASNDKISEKQKIAEIVVYLIAGHDTSGITISSALVLLARHPEILTKLQSDAVGLLPSQWSTSSTYYKYVIKEVQRIMPTLAMGSIRSLGQDYDTGNGEVMLKGSIAFCTQITPNYDDTIYIEPEAFNPDRWYNATPEMDNALLPFSIGLRNCVGKALGVTEIDTILPAILSRFDINLVKDGIPDYCLTLKFVGAELQLRRRG